VIIGDRDCISVFVFGDLKLRSLQGARCEVWVGWWEKENPMFGRILLARLADRFRSPWKQTSYQKKQNGTSSVLFV
jgi:hypothetical protein